MAWYYQGSIKIEAGSNVVTGTGTQWKVNLYGIGEGQALVIGNERLEILYVDSDTSIRLALPHAQGYTGSYHIETSYAGTGGDASRQISAALRRLTTLTFDWTEWMTSSAATIIATDALGQPVEIATYKALSAVAGDVGPLTDRVQSYDSANGISWKGGQSVVDLVKGYQMQMGLNDGWNNFGVGYIASKKGDTWSILQIPHESGTRQIASRQWVNNLIYNSGGNSTVMKNPATARVATIANDAGEVGGFDFQNSRWAFVHNQANFTIWGGITNNSDGAYVGYKSQRGDGTSVQWQTAAYSGNAAGTTSFAFYEQDKPAGATNVNQWRFLREGSVDIATRQWTLNTAVYKHSLLPQSINSDNQNTRNDLLAKQTYWDYRNLSYDQTRSFLSYPVGVSCGISTIDKIWGGSNHQVIASATFRGWRDASGNFANFQLISRSGVLYWRSGNAGLDTMSSAWTVWSEANTTTDGNGFIKRSSPIVTISNKGYTTNRESRGATVHKLETGKYQICNILGYNEDGLWGINGGIVVPKDNNGLELVFVKDKVNADGSIVIATYHRQHSHLPEPFQNHRIKEIVNGKPVYMQDGEQCDLPSFTRLDVRVGMPSDSIWNKRQEAARVASQLFLICKAQQDIINNKTLALPLL